MAYPNKNQRLIVLLASLASFACVADTVFEDIDPNDLILKQSFHIIAIVEAVSLSSEPHTNANPPSGAFRVNEVLRGYLKAESAECFWRTEKSPQDYEPWNDRMPESWRAQFYRRPLQKEWYARIIDAPRLGEKLIIFALQQHPEEREFPLLEIVRAVRATDKNTKIIINNMAPPDRNPHVQVCAMLILAGSGWGALALAIMSFQWRKSPRKLKRVAAVSILPFLLYVFFETGNRTGGIRIDLVFIYPALLMNGLSLVIASILLLIGKKRREEKGEG